MQIRVRTQNVTQAELAKALTGYIVQEGLAHEVAQSLQKSDHHGDEPIPERYMRTIVRRMQQEFKRLRLRLDGNVDKWFARLAKEPKHRAWQRTKNPKLPYMVSDEERDNLRLLIESHFKMAIGVKIRLPDRVEKEWSQDGIELPQPSLMRGVTQAFLAGRLRAVLDDKDSYEQMVEMARQAPLSRMDELTLEAVKANAAHYIVGYGRKMADLADEVLSEQHKGLLHDIVQDYFGGKLTHTTYNGEGLTPVEVASQLANKKPVQGTRELATELKNRFKAVDIGRDWDRVAESETRFASNLGALATIQEEGGGDPEAIYVYYIVQPLACASCKRVYLHEDGTPRLFTLAHILRNVRETGGMNVGRKASLIGEEGGWIPNAILHPNCHCRVVRWIKSYSTFEPYEEDFK